LRGLPTTGRDGTGSTVPKHARVSVRERLFFPLVGSNIVFATIVVLLVSQRKMELARIPVVPASPIAPVVPASPIAPVGEIVDTPKQPEKQVLPKNNFVRKPAKPLNAGKGEDQVGSEGGAWTAQTHLSVYGFNADWGLMEVLEDACREIENAHNAHDSQWHQYMNGDSHPLNGWWVAPKVVDAKVIEIGCGVGVYVDALKKDYARLHRRVFGLEPNPMGGTFERASGPRQIAEDLLSHDDPLAFAKSIRERKLKGDYFDLIYSIEVFEHLPKDRHEHAAKFLAGLARKGTKLVFGAASPGQVGTGHIGNRKIVEWETILRGVGFHKDDAATAKAQFLMQEFNHKKNTQVYWYHGIDQDGVQ
jgi:hypothetical protein